ncbi:RnfABCDGE type electron transport complex subunit B [uncultured Sphaerochaeta sp.]|uniref:RnfABCDGE type electron transport complex subunit B n=1 Tax=uncultured Sphaerochaeta sp. TaxID=886478 RepID=UPI002A0A0F7A|nr:RnfABCDGE type electron transport complex subunit B [uncultured Sphaerochaeta sp.]
MNILLAVLVVAILGGIFGYGLSFAEKKLAVKKDEKILALEKIMPGANCGGCGFAGCNAYAAAVGNGIAEIGLCNPGGAALNVKMAEIMGQEVKVSETGKMVAHVMCGGNCEFTTKDYDYKGLTDCNAAALLFGGDNTCKSGCLHLGSCIAVCPVEAISKDKDGFIIVDEDLCIGCGKCSKICPNGVIQLMNAESEYVIDCNNHDPGGKVRKQCTVGCIGCKICENKFPESGCKVENFLSKFDQQVPHSQIAEAAEACPSKCIVKR